MFNSQVSNAQNTKKTYQIYWQHWFENNLYIFEKYEETMLINIVKNDKLQINQNNTCRKADDANKFWQIIYIHIFSLTSRSILYHFKRFQFQIYLLIFIKITFRTLYYSNFLSANEPASLEQNNKLHFTSRKKNI